MSNYVRNYIKGFLWPEINLKFNYSIDTDSRRCQHDACSPLWSLLWSGSFLPFFQAITRQ